MSPEEADNVSPSRGLSLILVFSQSSLLGEAILVNPQKDKPTTNPPTHLPFTVFPLFFGERINTKPLSMAYKALHGPTDLSSNSFTCPSSPTGLFSVPKLLPATGPLHMLFSLPALLFCSLHLCSFYSSFRSQLRHTENIDKFY